MARKNLEKNSKGNSGKKLKVINDLINKKIYYKKFNLFLLMVLILAINNIYGQRGNYPNPAAVYSERMGYEYRIEIDEEGNEKGICILPDSTKVDAWDFYRGKVGKEYSYCVKNGYSMDTKIINENGYTIERPYCINSKQDNKDNFIELSMTELMARNGEPLINNEIIDAPDTSNIENSDDSLLKSVTSLPTFFDWRNYNGHTYVAPVRDQGACGSCYAFAAVACAEGVYNKATGSFDSKRKEFSESFIMWCLGSLSSYSSHFSGCNGADYDYKELEALTNEGICERSYFPYTTIKPSQCTHWNDPKALFSSWQRVSCNDINDIKTAIMNYGVVDAAVYVTSSFQNYTGDIYTDSYTSCSGSPCSHTAANHAISLVGWGYDATHGDYWILRNSWGASWGESGYMRIKATTARVACAVSYLVPNPVIFEADNISESNEISSESNVEFIGHNSITLTHGFKAEVGSNFRAYIQPTTTKSSTIISINEFDKFKQFGFKVAKDSELKNTDEKNISFSEQILDNSINNISIYPNPVTDFINIVDINESEITKIEIYNSSGSLIICNIDKTKLPISINVADVPSGMYIIYIKFGNHFFAKKIIKQ